jgi:hypothetical protein
VPLVRHSTAVTADVEVIPVAPAQPEGDASSVAGGTGRVLGSEATHGMGGVVGAAWGTIKIMGTARGAAEVDEAGNEGVVKGRAVRPPRLVVGPPGSVLWVV